MRWVIVAAIVFAATYIALDLNALYALRTNQNTGLYLQSISTFIQHGTTFDQPDGKPHLAVHDQWIMLGLTPFVALFPRPETLIAIQVLALAASALVLFRLAREAGCSARVATALSVAWLIMPSVQSWAYNGFTPEHFIPLIAFSLALAARRRSVIGVAIC